MKSLINWEELSKLGRPAPPPPKPGEEKKSQYGLWDKTAEFYNRMTLMELDGTLNQIDCIPISPDDVVLDACCGPGRIICQVAKRAKKVIGVDSSSKMLEKCRENVERNGLTNVETIYLDWNEAEPGVNVPMADIVIASRSLGTRDLEKLMSFARKYCVIIGWANSPFLPACAGRIFEGAVIETPDENRPPFPMLHDRRLSYNIQYNMIYDMGYEPNINVVKDGFERHFESREEAYEQLKLIQMRPAEIIEDKYRANVDRYLAENPGGGFDFRVETRTFVLGWEVNPRRFEENGDRGERRPQGNDGFKGFKKDYNDGGRTHPLLTNSDK